MRHKFDDEGKEHMRLLVSRVHRMGNLIDGILAVFESWSSQRRTGPRRCCSDVMREVIDFIAPPSNVTINDRKSLPTS